MEVGTLFTRSVSLSPAGGVVSTVRAAHKKMPTGHGCVSSECLVNSVLLTNRHPVEKVRLNNVASIMWI